MADAARRVCDVSLNHFSCGNDFVTASLGPAKL